MIQWVTATVNCYPIIQNLTAIRGTGIFYCNVAAVQDLNWKSFFRMECCQNFDERGEKFLGTLSFWTHCKGSVIFKSRGHGKHSGACTPLEFVKSHHLMKREHNEHTVSVPWLAIDFLQKLLYRQRRKWFVLYGCSFHYRSIVMVIDIVGIL